jgi:hypothetical protein
MATLGRREMTEKNRRNPPEVPAVGIGGPAVNLTASPFKVQLVTTLDIQSSSLGSPIMREDFITSTGLMAPKNR